jgi:formylglycine-generating enzyme required for sulfatase activity
MKHTGRVFLVAFSSLLLAAPAKAGQLPKEVSINGVEFVRVDGGRLKFPIPHIDPKTGYNLGSGGRVVEVQVDTFYIGKFEARARDFVRFMREGKPATRAQYDSPQPGVAGVGAEDGCAVRKAGGDYILVAPEQDLPVTHLSWDLASEFALWLGFRLPTEAEWMRAFRGDDERIFPWGDDYPDDTYAAFQEGATNCHVQPVDRYPKGRSPFGAFNMAGNVFEYVADWYNPDYYNALRDGVRNPVSTQPIVMPGDELPMRVLRGGRWASSAAEMSAAGGRDLRATSRPFICFGVRFAIDEAEVRRHLAAGTAQVLAR